MQHDIAALVQQLRATFNTGVTKSIEWRIQQLQQVKKMVQDNEDRIKEALKQDLNKCAMEAWNSEIVYITGEIDHTLKHLKKWAAPRKVPTPIIAQPGKSYLQPDPLGTVLVIGAWNYPFQLVLAPYVAALAAGNCAVLKPSELSPATSALIADLVPQYLDTSTVKVVEGAVDETTALLKQKFDHILYTGGEAVGKIVMRAAAEHLTPVTLELGGKSPCVVEKSCNIEVSAARIAWSKWMNAGQTCVAPDYVLVEASIAEEFTAALKAKISAFYGDNPEQSPDYGRIVNERHWQRICGYLEGQKVIHGGEATAETQYLAPTLVDSPAWDSPLMQQEIFGPILPIIPVQNIEETISLINARPKPLALYLFSENPEFEQKLMYETSAGNVCINDGMMFMANQDLPFGGVGNSGMGQYCGQSGFDTFSHLKAVMKRSYMLDVDLRYPPYNDKKMTMMKLLR